MRPQRRQPTRLRSPWDSPGKNTGVGCHFLLQCMKVKVKVKSLSRVWLFVTPWTAAYQAPPSMGFSRQEYWSGVPLPSLSVISTQVKSSSGWRERLLVLTPKCLHTKAGEQQGMRKWEKMIKPEFSKTLKVMDKVKAKRFITRQDRLYTYWTSLNSNFLQNEANYSFTRLINDEALSLVLRI